MNDRALKQSENSAVLWRRRTAVSPNRASTEFSQGNVTRVTEVTDETKGKGHPQRLAFIGICLFSILVTLRPQDFSPTLGDALPYAKIVAVVTLLLYLGSKLQRGERPFIWPIEMKMMIAIGILGLLSIAVASSPKDTFDVLTDPFLKVLIIFAIMIDIVDSQKRLNILLNVVVVCGALVALYTIEAYFAGDFIKGRLVVLRDTLFGNSNDLALIFDLLLPIAIVLALYRQKTQRLLYVLAALILGFGTLITFSRGGFLGLAAGGAVLMWKLARNNRMAPVIAVGVLLLALLFAVPGGYGGRLMTIINIQQDETGSAQEREDLMIRAGVVALSHPILGIGMGNFHTYSIHEKRAHNSFLEIAAELGIPGLIAFVILVIAPLWSLRKIELDVKQDSNSPPDAQRQEIYYLSVGLQAVLVAYIVCSCFSSNQYFWYLYYPVAYAVSLRRIHTKWAESRVQAINPINKFEAVLQEHIPEHAQPKTGGALWQPRGLKPAAESPSGVIWRS